MKERLDRVVVFILIGALFVNCLCVFVVIPLLSIHLKPLYNQDSFQDGYDLLAANLAGGRGYRFYPDTGETLMREPGYPLLLAGLRLAFGSGLMPVKVANFGLVALTALLIAWLAREAAGQHRLIAIAPVLFLVHPGTLIAESRGAVETVFTALITLFIVTLYRAVENGAWRQFAFAGGILGVTVLVRSTLIMFPVFLLAYLLIAERGRTRALTVLRNVGCMMTVMVLVLSPWIVRNYALTTRFVPTASVLGVSAQTGQYICSHLTLKTRWVDLDRAAARERERLAEEAGYRLDRGYYQVFYNPADELAFSDYLLKTVIQTYRSDPLLCAKCVALNVVNLWCAGKTWSSTAMSVAVQIPYLLLAMVGVLLRVREGKFRSIGPVALLIGYTVCVYVPILAQARYSVPLIPFVSTLTAVGLRGLWGGCAGKLHAAEQSWVADRILR